MKKNIRKLNENYFISNNKTKIWFERQTAERFVNNIPTTKLFHHARKNNNINIIIFVIDISFFCENKWQKLHVYYYVILYYVCIMLVIKFKFYIIKNCKVIILTELIINKLLISTRTSQLSRKKKRKLIKLVCMKPIT